MGFKEDITFARFLTMGVHGTAAVKADLVAHGHQVVELERYAMANKIWTVKVKRMRVPDLLCVSCGRRFESKAKSKLELKLSHSGTSGREWWGSGMRLHDVYSFVRVVMDGPVPNIGRPFHVTRQSLEDSVGDLKDGVRKAIADGAEADVSWPIWVPSYTGEIVAIEPAPRATIQVVSAAGRRATRGQLAWKNFYPYLEVGDRFEADATPVAGTVQFADISCEGETWQWEDSIESKDESDAFCAVKAAGFHTLTTDSRAHLSRVLNDGSANWRLRLEAAGVLAKDGSPDALAHLAAVALSLDSRDGAAMEAVFILGEVGDAAAHTLHSIARSETISDSEVRAASVWTLGVGGISRPDLILDFLADQDDLVALHAASALTNSLPDAQVEVLTQWLVEGTDRQMAVSAAVLARHVRIQELIQVVRTGTGRGALFALRALGDLDSTVVLQAVPDLDPRQREMLDAIWIQHDDWLRGSDTEGALDILAAQQLRFW